MVGVPGVGGMGGAARLAPLALPAPLRDGGMGGGALRPGGVPTAGGGLTGRSGGGGAARLITGAGAGAAGTGGADTPWFCCKKLKINCAVSLFSSCSRVTPAFSKTSFHSSGMLCALNPRFGSKPMWPTCLKSLGVLMSLLLIFLRGFLPFFLELPVSVDHRPPMPLLEDPF